MKFLLTPLMMAIAAAVLSPLASAATKDMTLASFSKVNINVPIDFVVAVGKKQSFTMEGPDELLALIKVEVKDGTLDIRKKRRFELIEKISVRITMEDLTKFVITGASDGKISNVNSKIFALKINGYGDVVIEGKSDELTVTINGGGEVKSESFHSAELSANITGSGDISLAGECENLDLSIRGSGNFSGRKLTCANVNANIHGSGDATFYASSAAEIRTNGNSDVNVYGNPKSIQNRSGSSSNLVVHEDK
ncbi:MAG: hypothetical protein COA93_00540 [Alphaproteobacteria bacterium]|nr:MAG: hypothetical protein COA93_00540 [Alphaproteobacteria bacterium]